MARKQYSVPTDSAMNQALARAGFAGVDTNLFLKELIRSIGGPEKLASMVIEEFHAAKKGSVVRQRFVEMIQRLIINTTASESGKSRVVAEMTDDELDGAFREYASRLNVYPMSSDYTYELPAQAGLPGSIQAEEEGVGVEVEAEADPEAEVTTAAIEIGDEDDFHVFTDPDDSPPWADAPESDDPGPD